MHQVKQETHGCAKCVEVEELFSRTRLAHSRTSQLESVHTQNRSPGSSLIACRLQSMTVAAALRHVS